MYGFAAFFGKRRFGGASRWGAPPSWRVIPAGHAGGRTGTRCREERRGFT